MAQLLLEAAISHSQASCGAFKARRAVWCDCHDRVVHLGVLRQGKANVDGNGIGEAMMLEERELEHVLVKAWE